MAFEKRDDETAGEFLKRVIYAKGLTSNGLGTELNNSPSPASIRLWFTENGRPTKSRLRRLAEALGADAGPAVLRAFDMDDVAEVVEENFAAGVSVGGAFTLSYGGSRTLTDNEAARVRSVIEAITAD